MNALLAALTGLPVWAVDGVLVIAATGVRLLRATNDDDREEALMAAAEGIKAALDAKKFGTP